MKKFKVGESYRYSEIPQEDTEEYTISEYGLEYLGQHAIHIRYHETESYKCELDIWFIWDRQGTEAIFKCVYKA